MKNKTIFLIPPSEWKNPWWTYKEEKTFFKIIKPCQIAINATEKDLKCTWKRLEEANKLNKSLCKNTQKEYLEAIKRYSWIMYKYIDYENMKNKDFFDNHFYIISWMYWVLKPKDIIWNYKLPIETKWLYDFFWDIIPSKIISLKPDYIVNLLPISYAKTIWEWTNCSKHKKKKQAILNAWIKIINVNFYKKDWKKISHWVKKVKWEWIKNICENKIINYKYFWWKIRENDGWTINIDLVV